jgi:hypothetical protein
MSLLEAKLADYQQLSRRPLKTNQQRVAKRLDRYRNKLENLIKEWNSIENDQDIEYSCFEDIKKTLKEAHSLRKKTPNYVQADLDRTESGIYEHVIPVIDVASLLIQGYITADQALNSPICQISKDNDRLLEEKKLRQRTPDVYNFWKRYTECFDIELTTYEGHPIDTNMTLDDHYKMFL